MTKRFTEASLCDKEELPKEESRVTSAIAAEASLAISYLLRRRVREMDIHDYAITRLTIASYRRELSG